MAERLELEDAAVADVEVPRFVSRSWRKVCRAALLLDVLFVLPEALCVTPDVLFALFNALLPEAPWIAETRLLKSDCSVLRMLFVEEVEAVEELAPNS